MKELILQNDDDTNRLGKDIAKELKAAEISSIEIHLEEILVLAKHFYLDLLLRASDGKI